MRDFIIEDPLGIITVPMPDKHCVFCSHCSDVFYDYSNGPYLFYALKTMIQTHGSTAQILTI